MPPLIVHSTDAGRIVLMDSIAYITEEYVGDIIVCGSHGGKSAALHAAKFRPKGVIFNDAGKGKEEAGISGLQMLEKEGIMGAAVDAMSARIGEGLDSHDSGVISAVNGRAFGAGITIGMPAKEAALKMLNSAE
ncbi:MAG: hypothetical protein NTY64_22305 [Deltaproteobacteria bacterium]|nr:hypothetical protein [Deltaproteobacteria bacterium]